MLSKIASDAKPSATLSLNSLAKQMKSEGKDIVSFTVGEPDFDTPDNIRQAAIRAIQAGYTKYTPASGEKKLREAIAKKFSEDNGLEYSPEQIIVSNGAKQALYMMMLSVLDPGDDVLLPVPYWVSYSSQARVCGANPLPVDTTGHPELKLTPDQLEETITENSKLLILNSPCNPNGVVYSRDELSAFADIADRHDLWIFADEVYEKLIYDDNEHISIASLSDDIYNRTITFNAVSKTYAMTGWRIGYAAGPQDAITAAGRLQSNLTSGPNSIAQHAAIEALTGDQSSVLEMRETFRKRRDLLVNGLNEIEGVKCSMPGGAFYAFPDCWELLGKSYNGEEINDSISLSKALIETVHLAVVPGKPFGAEGHIRLSYAVPESEIEKGLKRLAEFQQMAD